MIKKELFTWAVNVTIFVAAFVEIQPYKNYASNLFDFYILFTCLVLIIAFLSDVFNDTEMMRETSEEIRQMSEFRYGYSLSINVVRIVVCAMLGWYFTGAVFVFYLALTYGARNNE